MKKNYPISEGWFHLKLTLKKGALPFQESQLLKMIGLETENAEVAEFKTGKSSQIIIARKKQEHHG